MMHAPSQCIRICSLDRGMWVWTRVQSIESRPKVDKNISGNDSPDQADIPFPPRRVGESELISVFFFFGNLSGISRKRSCSSNISQKNKSQPAPATSARPKPWAVIQRNPHSLPTRICPCQPNTVLGPSEPLILSCHNEPHRHINPNTSLRCLHRQDKKTLCFIQAPRRV